MSKPVTGTYFSTGSADEDNRMKAHQLKIIRHFIDNAIRECADPTMVELDIEDVKNCLDDAMSNLAALEQQVKDEGEALVPFEAPEDHPSRYGR
jgi:hypothetical protein